MSTRTIDPLALAVRDHLAQLRREATQAALAREVRGARRRTGWSWPRPVVAALRESFVRRTGSGAPCPTC